MPRNKSPAKRSGRPPAHDRRAPPASPGTLRWIKSLLGRPLGLQRRGSQLHVALVDRRRPPEVVEADAIQRLCAELRTRLMIHDNDRAAAVMRDLVTVHETLSKRGWTAVGELPSKLLGRALVQAQMLATHEPSRGMSELIDRLNVLQPAAVVREDRLERTGAMAVPSTASKTDPQA